MHVGMLEVRRLMSVVVATATLTACGDDDSTNPSATIAIALSPATVSVQQGANGTATVALTRSGGFTGDVAIAVEGLPTGVTVAPVTIGASSTSGVLTFTASATAAPATTTVTVRATGTGVTAKTATLALTVTAAPAQSYTIAVAPATTSIARGANGNVTVTLTRTGGFAGAVGLAVTGLPTGVTAAFNPQSIPGTSSTSTITVTAAANATVGGPTTITVTGTATGQTARTATFQLTVTATAAGGFTLSLAPTTVNVQQGGTATSAVTINRTNGFAGAVTLTATGLPNGVTAAFNPAAPTTNTSTLTLTAAANATAGGPTTVTVRGNATGISEQTVTLALTVTAVTGGTGNTTWEFCTAGDTPLWFAVQDGDGAWTRVAPTGSTFKFNVTSAKGGVAFVTGATSGSIASASRTLAARMSMDLRKELLLRNRPSTRRAYAANALVDGFSLSIVYGTQAELNSQGTNRCLPGTGKTVNGSVANVDPGQAATATLGPSSATIVGGSGTTFQLTKVPDGALDLIASRSTTNSVVDKVIIRRGLNQANGSTIPVLNFDAAEAFVPATANITVGNLNGEVAAISTLYFTSFGSGASGAGLASANVPGPGPYTYYGVPAAKQAAGDLHLVQAAAYPSSQDLTQSRSSALFFKDPTDRAVTLGPALTLPAVSPAATTPYVRFSATGPIQTQYSKAVVAIFTQANTEFRQAVISASEGYLAGSFTYDLTIPDFTGVSGWDNNWGPAAGTTTLWIVSATGYTGAGVGTPTPAEGVTFSSAARSGSITIIGNAGRRSGR